MAEKLLFCVAAAVICAAHGATLNFTFPPQTHLKWEGDAYFQGEKFLQLTKNQASGSLANSSGWVTYTEPIPLWDEVSGVLANFITHFKFSIGQGNNDNSNYGYGDGLSFFLAPSELARPLNAYGGGIGMFNSTRNETSLYQPSSYKMVAVEFDTYENFWDPDGNHVGIDVNSIISRTNVSLSNGDASVANWANNETLNNGKQWDAWVDYDGGSKTLELYLLYNPDDNNITKPAKPILSYKIDLSKHLPENVKVGLSASTGWSTETHSVTFWNFTSQHSWPDSTSAPASEPTAAQPGHSSTSAPPKSKNRSMEIVLIWVFVPFVAICSVILAGSLWYYRYRSVDTSAGNSDVELDECFAQGPRRFPYAELAAATGNFSEDHKLGQGGFGGVYRGTLAGLTVAVKRVSQGSKQGRKEYISEVNVISKLRHLNLVQLLGWCHQKGDLLLVYEFLPNGSLDKYIFEESKVNLEWQQRYSIACDIASALVYLHEECVQRVVHRDVKASNVMLDSNFTAKLGDFGLARMLERDSANSHTTVVAGTLGYLAPECVATGKASTEADVFSFGAVTLEIACGRPPVDRTLVEYNCRLVEWVWDLHSQGRILDAADERLNGNFDHEEMKRLMSVGLICSHPDSKARPGMRQVLKILKSETELPNIPSNFPVAVYNDDRQRVREVTLCSANSLNASTWSTGGVSLSSSSSGQNAASPLLHADE